MVNAWNVADLPVTDYRTDDELYQDKDGNPDLDKDYYKYAGQDFWNFISQDQELYRKIIVPISQEGRQKDEIFKKAYAAKINEMTQDFMEKFMKDNQIDWLKLVDFVSKNKTKGDISNA
jgi:site-specific DNA-methyltransferase (cytosine-N4-specific)